MENKANENEFFFFSSFHFTICDVLLWSVHEFQFAIEVSFSILFSTTGVAGLGLLRNVEKNSSVAVAIVVGGGAGLFTAILISAKWFYRILF